MRWKVTFFASGMKLSIEGKVLSQRMKSQSTGSRIIVQLKFSS